MFTAGKANALLSQDLATIDRKARLPFSLADLTIPPPDPPTLNALFKTLEFYSLLSREETVAHKAESAVGGHVKGIMFDRMRPKNSEADWDGQC